MRNKLPVLLLTSLVMTCQVSAESFLADVNFLKKYDTPIVLSSDNQQQKLVVSAKHQARILTSTANGDNGLSNGWFEYGAIKQGKSSGGEDRFWLAPIGTRQSLYYPQGERFIPEQWHVPAPFSTQAYQVISQSQTAAEFSAKLTVHNMMGTEFNVALLRRIQLFESTDIEQYLGLTAQDLKNVSSVGFGSTNTLTNLGKAFNLEQGAVTIWILGTFHGTEQSKAFLPVKKSQTTASVRQYLSDFKDDKLSRVGDVVMFKTDGRFRSKIGLTKELATDLMLNYSPELERLTVIKFSYQGQGNFPIAFEQDVPLTTLGDVTNIYNHGGVPTKQNPTPYFYEMETAAPMKLLQQGERVSHQHNTFHFFGNEAQLSMISKQLAGVELSSLR